MLRVEATHAGADVLTRRSLLGSSGRVGYVAGVNATWTLMDVASGRVHSGGRTQPALQMTHDLTTGRSTASEVVPVLKLSGDPLSTTEWVFRIAVLLLAAAVAMLGLAAAVSDFD